MIDEILKITEFMIKAFIHIWPYLLITIPIAVAVNMSGASKYIKKAFNKGPIIAIFLATLVGAFSPFCSCGVIPVIAALLISGVPVAPIMSFWIASPSMDPEIFFLSVGTIGWDLAVWRLAGTLFLSLGAGFITHVAVKSHFLGTDILRNNKASGIQAPFTLFLNSWNNLKRKSLYFSSYKSMNQTSEPLTACCGENVSIYTTMKSGAENYPSETMVLEKPAKTGCGCKEEIPFKHRLFQESLKATTMVIKFMALAFFLEALIILYVPSEWITGLMGRDNSWAIIMAAFLGVPTYTSNLSALPMVGGLLEQGMSPAAALAFLIAGPTTTLPAMAAVYTLVNRKVFVLYVSFALLGAILLGYLKSLAG